MQAHPRARSDDAARRRTSGPGWPRLVMAVLLLAAAGASAQDIDVLGNWSVSIDSSDLTAGAGSDLTRTVTSAAGQIEIEISNCSGNSDTWRVDVERSDSNWPSGLALAVVRTSDGSGGGSISGGTSLVTVESTSSTFFSGAGDRIEIDAQIRLRGFSVAIPPDNYSTTVIYTVVDL